MTWTRARLHASADDCRAVLEVADAGRRIYRVDEGGESFWRFDEHPDNLIDGSNVLDEVEHLRAEGMLTYNDVRDLVITDRGRRWLGEEP